MTFTSKTVAADANLDELLEEVCFSGLVSNCELCQRPLKNEAQFLDCAIPSSDGSWGCVCTYCAAIHRIRPAWGQAQLYQQQAGPDGMRWRLLAGHPPAGAEVA